MGSPEAEDARVRGLWVLRSPDNQAEVASRQVEHDSALPVAVPLPRGRGTLLAAGGASLEWAGGSERGRPAPAAPA